ncbi:TauD/TfdA family dioxygenase [Actinomadura sp. DC4]|uniref:TauD/TfdA family dioxygenase n=1 Tax=Actinomadura sp. DC4 TaxID=3055069 RepID=UPI0025AF61BA|nr:TauD/TfdA family dioxygenase [Actinomadura sp. DC4]MDN3358519.1 TauD/TfdA family dioxygenase [Actinomadura sp. DC4]
MHNARSMTPVSLGAPGADEVVRIQETDSQRLWQFAQQLASGHPIEQLDDAEQLTELGTVVAAMLPEAVLRQVHRFRNQGNRHDVLLLRGILPAGYDLEPTPETATSPRHGAANLCALCLMAVMNMFGEPFTFSDLYDGRLVQDVVAAQGKESAQTSEGSDSFLEWHVEDAFSSDRCDYFGLLCLRGDPTAATIFAPARALVLPDEARKVLMQPRYAVLPDIAHGENPEPRTGVAVLTGTREAPEIRFDPVYMVPADPADDEAKSAFQCLTEAVDAAAVSHVLQPGDLLVVDNRRVAHARSPFRPRFDGSDRWLLRVMVCSSLPRHRRRGALRAIRSGAADDDDR